MSGALSVSSHDPRGLKKNFGSIALFSLTLFTSASLLFLLEPMFAKMALPVLGGTTSVWVTCMLFYQVMLLAGYGFADAVMRRLTNKQQALLLVFVALAPVAILPFHFPSDRVPPPDSNPIPWL